MMGDNGPSNQNSTFIYDTAVYYDESDQRREDIQKYRDKLEHNKWGFSVCDPYRDGHGERMKRFKQSFLESRHAIVFLSPDVLERMNKNLEDAIEFKMGTFLSGILESHDLKMKRRLIPIVFESDDRNFQKPFLLSDFSILCPGKKGFYRHLYRSLSKLPGQHTITPRQIRQRVDAMGRDRYTDGVLTEVAEGLDIPEEVTQDVKREYGGHKAMLIELSPLNVQKPPPLLLLWIQQESGNIVVYAGSNTVINLYQNGANTLADPPQSPPEPTVEAVQEHDEGFEEVNQVDGASVPTSTNDEVLSDGVGGLDLNTTPPVVVGPTHDQGGVRAKIGKWFRRFSRKSTLGADPRPMHRSASTSHAEGGDNQALMMTRRSSWDSGMGSTITGKGTTSPDVPAKPASNEGIEDEEKLVSALPNPPNHQVEERKTLQETKATKKPKASAPLVST
uniref:TIR domain-containing protein n=1 Tax=Branchiostoma floridae TaxID=7739 RepID=C3YQE6_BRAFL|eukprot:XP_002601464.1 hypothetical protein BRAFLDRAFT_130784 [Branchiostoma floridae]